MKLTTNHAWHFICRVGGKDLLRDGTTAPNDGEWLEFHGPLVMCESGLHFSRHPFDALTYAPGEILCLVEIGGTIIDGDDKGVCRRRKIIRRFDATEGLRFFARMQALSCIHLYPGDPEDCVLDWLMTGDPALQSAAWSAAESAAWSAAESAAWAAARSAAWAAAESAAGSAAWAATRSAAWSAAWAATRSAAEAAAMSEARDEWADLVYEAFGVEK